MGLGDGGLGAGNPGKVVLVTDILASDARDLLNRFGIDPRTREVLMADDIAAGIDLTTANRGDHVMVAPSHYETLTAKLDLDVAGITVKGLGQGLEKPTLYTATAIDMVEFSGDNIVFDGFHFAAVGIDAVTALINIDDAGAVVRNITSGDVSASAKAPTDCITVTANADDCLIENVKLYCSAHPVNSFLSLEGAASRVTVKDFRAFGDVDTAGIIDAAKIDYLWLEDIIVGVVGTTKPAITLDSNPEGMAINVKAAGTHGTLATNCNLGNLMRIFENRVTEETDGSAQGAIIPAADTD